MPPKSASAGKLSGCSAEPGEPAAGQGRAAEAAAAPEVPKSRPPPASPSLQKQALPLGPSSLKEGLQRSLAATRTSTQEGFRSVLPLLCLMSLFKETHIKKKKIQKQKPPNKSNEEREFLAVSSLAKKFYRKILMMDMWLYHC